MYSWFRKSSATPRPRSRDRVESITPDALVRVVSDSSVRGSHTEPDGKLGRRSQAAREGGLGDGRAGGGEGVFGTRTCGWTFERTRTMPQLKFHPAHLREALDPIPFPRSSWTLGGIDEPRLAPRWQEGAPTYRFAARMNDASNMTDSVLERAQRQMDRLRELLGSNFGDDRPSAA